MIGSGGCYATNATTAEGRKRERKLKVSEFFSTDFVSIGHRGHNNFVDTELQ
ncbi:MAG TPA: hypothetical protein VLF89_02705 [Candidatus Saccharimonadales bacterium]|nr:hypothetical protein [Candidatus Saccharimonadales bacterium]